MLFAVSWQSLLIPALLYSPVTGHSVMLQAGRSLSVLAQLLYKMGNPTLSSCPSFPSNTAQLGVPQGHARWVLVMLVRCCETHLFLIPPLSQILVLESVPDINLLDYLPEILDGLFQILGDNSNEIRKM